MANEFDDRENEETLESLTKGETSFDDFLNRKAQKVCEPVPLSRIKETDVPSNAPDAEESSSELKSTSSDEIKESEPIHAAPAAEEKALKIDLHKHEIIGYHATEQHVTIELDDEWKEVFFTEYKQAVLEMSAEEIIERRHKLDRAVTLLRARDQGLQLALEEVLKSRNSKDRASIMEMQAALRAERSKRVVTKRQTASKKAAASKPALSIAASRDKDTKKGISLARTFINMDYDEPAVIKTVQEAGLLREGVLSFIKKHFGG